MQQAAADSGKGAHVRRHEVVGRLSVGAGVGALAAQAIQGPVVQPGQGRLCVARAAARGMPAEGYTPSATAPLHGRMRSCDGSEDSSLRMQVLWNGLHRPSRKHSA